jgi:hypothetical protein
MSKNVLELYKIGSRVKLTDDVYGTIEEINIFGDNSVSYKCGWWNGRSYCAEHFAPNAIEVVMPEKFKIGFHNE